MTGAIIIIVVVLLLVVGAFVMRSRSRGKLGNSSVTRQMIQDQTENYRSRNDPQDD